MLDVTSHVHEHVISSLYRLVLQLLLPLLKVLRNKKRRCFSCFEIPGYVSQCFVYISADKIFMQSVFLSF